MQERFDVEITVQRNGERKSFFLKEKESLMDGLLREGYYISAVCGGMGRCGKCKVQVCSGQVPITSGDVKFFTSAELEAGWRLSCLAYPTEDITIVFDLNDESDFEAASGFDQGKQYGAECEKTEQHRFHHPMDCNIAIDIGTTTIALQLLDGMGQELCALTTINSQRKYGADVISRIQASLDGKKDVLQQSIGKDLQDGISSLLEAGGFSLEQVQRVCIACNTTMSHLLIGYDCESLGVYPFTPVDIDFVHGKVKDVIGLQSDADVVILPGISTYVGGDIVSGLYACGFHESEEICLLVDLGTNGEMALGNRERLLVTSTAAGPAFEGGNIIWGTGSVAGAICGVELERFPEEIVARTRTIRDKSPIGICGTGVIEAISEMLREEVIDEMGLLAEDYFEEGFPLALSERKEQIVITQKDIRELQLAKAAVRAGIETLCLRYGVNKNQVSKVYLAGGFGLKLDVEKAMAIGMLPDEFAGRILAVGNSALAGTVRFLKESQTGESAEAKQVLREIVNVSEEIGLSTDKDFNRLYMENMMFE